MLKLLSPNKKKTSCKAVTHFIILNEINHETSTALASMSLWYYQWRQESYINWIMLIYENSWVKASKLNQCERKIWKMMDFHLKSQRIVLVIDLEKLVIKMGQSKLTKRYLHGNNSANCEPESSTVLLSNLMGSRPSRRTGWVTYQLHMACSQQNVLIDQASRWVKL